MCISLWCFYIRMRRTFLPSSLAHRGRASSCDPPQAAAVAASRERFLTSRLRRRYRVDASVFSCGSGLTWRKALGSTVRSFSGADGDGDGVVGQSDYDVWRFNFGRAVPRAGSGSSVGSGLVAISSAATSPASGTRTLTTPSAYTGSTTVAAGSLSVSATASAVDANVATTLVATDPPIALTVQPAAISVSNAELVAIFVQAPFTSQGAAAGVLAI